MHYRSSDCLWRFFLCAQCLVHIVNGQITASPLQSTPLRTGSKSIIEFLPDTTDASFLDRWCPKSCGYDGPLNTLVIWKKVDYTTTYTDAVRIIEYVDKTKNVTSRSTSYATYYPSLRQNPGIPTTRGSDGHAVAILTSPITARLTYPSELWIPGTDYSVEGTMRTIPANATTEVCFVTSNGYQAVGPPLIPPPPATAGPLDANDTIGAFYLPFPITDLSPNGHGYAWPGLGKPALRPTDLWPNEVAFNMCRTIDHGGPPDVLNAWTLLTLTDQVEFTAKDTVTTTSSAGSTNPSALMTPPAVSKGSTVAKSTEFTQPTTRTVSTAGAQGSTTTVTSTLGAAVPEVRPTSKDTSPDNSAPAIQPSVTVIAVPSSAAPASQQMTIGGQTLSLGPSGAIVAQGAQGATTLQPGSIYTLASAGAPGSTSAPPTPVVLTTDKAGSTVLVVGSTGAAGDASAILSGIGAAPTVAGGVTTRSFGAPAVDSAGKSTGSGESTATAGGTTGSGGGPGTSTGVNGQLRNHSTKIRTSVWLGLGALFSSLLLF